MVNNEILFQGRKPWDKTALVLIYSVAFHYWAEERKEMIQLAKQFFYCQGIRESKQWKTGSLSHFQNLRVRSWASCHPDNGNSAGLRSACNNQLTDGWPQWKTTHHPLIPASAKESGTSHKAMIYTLLLLSNHQAIAFITLMFFITALLPVQYLFY